MRSLAARCSVKSKRGMNPIAETPAGKHQPRLLRSTSAWRGNCIASGCLHKSILATAARPASSRIGQRLSLASHDPLPRFGRGSMSWSFGIIFTVCHETLFIPCLLSSPRILVQPQLFSRGSFRLNSRMSSAVRGRPNFSSRHFFRVVATSRSGSRARGTLFSSQGGLETCSWLHIFPLISAVGTIPFCHPSSGQTRRKECQTTSNTATVRPDTPGASPSGCETACWPLWRLR